MITNLRSRIIAILDALDHEEWLPGIEYLAENDPPALEFGGHTTMEPDEDIEPDCVAILAGGLFLVLWARWRTKRLDPRFGGQNPCFWISVFDMNEPTDGSGHFPKYRATATTDLECLIMAAELELGIIEGR